MYIITAQHVHARTCTFYYSSYCNIIKTEKLYIINYSKIKKFQDKF